MTTFGRSDDMRFALGELTLANRPSSCQAVRVALAIRIELDSSEVVRNGEASSPARRRHRPRGYGRGEKAHRFHESARTGRIGDRWTVGVRVVIRSDWRR